MRYAEEAKSPLVIRCQGGQIISIESIVGGGMMIGGPGYEVHFIDSHGNDRAIYQHEIVEVFDPETNERFQFGNPYLPGHPSNRS